MAMRDNASLTELIETTKRASPGAMAKIVAFARAAIQAEEVSEQTERDAWLEAAEPLEPYDWGTVDPKTLGQPVTYVEGIGAVVEFE